MFVSVTAREGVIFSGLEKKIHENLVLLGNMSIGSSGKEPSTALDLCKLE